MKILTVHNIHYIGGGAGRGFIETNRLLMAHGHDVIPFSVSSRKNIDSKYSPYFLSDIQKGSYFVRLSKRLARSFYSLEAKRAIERIVRDYSPALAHLHKIEGGISSSILPVLKNNGIPIVQTLHDYELFCATTLFYNFSNKGRVCERCKFRRYYNCFLSSCSPFAGAPFKGVVNMLKMYFQDLVLNYERYIDRFIAPSNFMKRKAIEYGIKEEKIIYIPHFISLEQYEACYEHDDYIIYFGRLYEQKGIGILIKAMERVPDLDLLVVGSGPMHDNYVQLVKQMGIKNVKFLGFKSGNDLRRLVRRAMFSVLPSRHYENASFSLYESLALGTPVLGANIGGNPEFIEEGKDGWLFEPDNIEGLANKIRDIIKNKGGIKEMRKRAREKMESEYSAEKHYRKLENAYCALINCRRLCKQD